MRQAFVRFAAAFGITVAAWMAYTWAKVEIERARERANASPYARLTGPRTTR